MATWHAASNTTTDTLAKSMIACATFAVLRDDPSSFDFTVSPPHFSNEIAFHDTLSHFLGDDLGKGVSEQIELVAMTRVS